MNLENVSGQKVMTGKMNAPAESDSKLEARLGKVQMGPTDHKNCKIRSRLHVISSGNVRCYQAGLFTSSSGFGK
jgi:hypothetical protein